MEEIKNIDFIAKKLAERNIDISKYKIETQTKCSVCGEITTFTENGYVNSRDCKCMRNYRIKKNIERYSKLSIADRNYSKDTFENATKITAEEKELYSKMLNYCKNFETALEKNIGALFIGNIGTGKTYLANCICNELNNNNYSVLSFNLSSYFNKIRNNDEEEQKFLNAVKVVDLLFIDDLGSEQINRKNGSLWAEEKLFNLFDTRYRVGKPLLITTNLSDKQLKEHLKINGIDKVFDRLREMCKPFIMNFENKRKNKDFVLF